MSTPSAPTLLLRSAVRDHRAVREPRAPDGDEGARVREPAVDEWVAEVRVATDGARVAQGGRLRREASCVSNRASTA